MLILSLAMLAGSDVSATERRAIFAAAGFKESHGQWRSDCDDPGTDSYEPGKIEHYGDINGDGQPEAIVTEGGTFCYGNTGTGFTLLTRAHGAWGKLYQSQGVATILRSKAKGWPEIEVGGPGFCFPILGWTGKAYDIRRHAYEGRPCKP